MVGSKENPWGFLADPKHMSMVHEGGWFSEPIPPHMGKREIGWRKKGQKNQKAKKAILDGVVEEDETRRGRREAKES